MMLEDQAPQEHTAVIRHPEPPSDNGYRTSRGRTATQVIEDVSTLERSGHETSALSTVHVRDEMTQSWRASIDAATDAGTMEFEGHDGIEA